MVEQVGELGEALDVGKPGEAARHHLDGRAHRGNRRRHIGLAIGGLARLEHAAQAERDLEFEPEGPPRVGGIDGGIAMHHAHAPASGAAAGGASGDLAPTSAADPAAERGDQLVLRRVGGIGIGRLQGRGQRLDRLVVRVRLREQAAKGKGVVHRGDQVVAGDGGRAAARATCYRRIAAPAGLGAQPPQNR
ncbi:hypothetical protein [Burkholderia gladioli]|uniref:hypothetical protein n=1 Tax=Burkholderia gladioli TaxID=28095 RepID=UPI003D1FC6BF